MTWYVALAVFALGMSAGVLSGMLGIGGAVITTPGIRVLGATPLEAVGSTVPAILPSALSGTWRYARAGMVDWRIGGICGVAGSVLAVGGAWVSDLLNPHLLMVLTAILLGWSGVSTVRSGRRVRAEPEPALVSLEPVITTTRAHTGAAMLMLVGSGAGFLAGLLGVGGGIVLMPAFTVVLRIPIKEAVASSLVAVAIFSVPALVTHVALGHVNWSYALLLMAGGAPGAQIGSHLTLGASDRTVRLIFGAFMVVVAAIYGTAELLAL